MRKRHSAPDEVLAFMRVRKVPLSPKIERGTPLPRAFKQLPFLCCWRRKVPVCAPKSLKPRGRGGAFQNHRTVSTQDKLTHGHTQTQKVNDRSSSSDKPPTLGLYVRLESHGPAGLPRSERCAARQQPFAPSANGLGSPSRPGKATAALRGRPLLKLQPLGPRELRRPRWLCSRGSCLSAPACRSRSARARRLPGRSPPPPLPPGHPQGFSVGVPRS